jgi:hypothetical protein
MKKAKNSFITTNILFPTLRDDCETAEAKVVNLPSESDEDAMGKENYPRPVSGLLTMATVDGGIKMFTSENST